MSLIRKAGQGTSNSIGARPPIRWNGGKRYRLGQIGSLLAGRDWSDWHYIEPMIGGGAAFWEFGHLFKSRAISDVLPELINFFRVIQNDVDGLITSLRDRDLYWFHGCDDPTSKAHFLSIRKRYGQGTPVERAATFLYLNKTAINGLHRLNNHGGFNAAAGSYKNPKLVDEPLLRACSTALAGTLILDRDVVDILKVVRAGRSRKVLLSIDPPYHGGGYTGHAGGFSDVDQERLVRAMLDTGRKYIYTNSDTPFIRSLFAGSAVAITALPLVHKVGPKAARGRTTGELLIHNL